MILKVLDFLDAEHSGIVSRLDALLRIPSVSPDPQFAPYMQAARAYLLERLREIGLSNVCELDGGGEPAVFGEWLGAPGKPTIMIYGHYDVQPADPVELWRTPPFEPTHKDGRVYARGASDVKGSTVVALEVIAAFLKVQGALPVNVKVFLEGEEETGSPSLTAIVDRYRDRLDVDAVLSADGGRASATVPTINTGARGAGQLEFRVTTASKDLHSGRYGGCVRNALHEMAVIVASLHRSDGTVAVPGFYANATPPTQRERDDTATFPFDQAAFFDDVDAIAHGEPGYTAREQITLRPALDINGMWGGYTGEGGKTIIPNTARAKLTVRIVPGQTSESVLHAVERHLHAVCPQGVGLEILHRFDGAPASTLAMDHPLVLAAEQVLTTEFERTPLHVRLGASVPVTSLFKAHLGVDTLMFGYNLPDEDVHAPNEFFRLSSITEGVRGWAQLLEALGHFPKDAFHPK
ncbi:dipeptidase [Pandoraea sp. ISTKB]|uniref:dipeptidase n=1 Tax=Pandoraea sp. ISTKB TaxID=1586708 RepID=UPI00084722AB|nr:dipeptidase [Pandoraea sp. ISTKB]ODP31729.1 peptidase M20 [Pandoraea sp. ISTKB]